MKPEIPVPHNPHRLINRQLRKAFPDGVWSESGMREFIQSVNDSYHYSDEERKLNQRAESIGFAEIDDINEELRQKNEFLDSFNHGLAHDIKNHSSNLQGLVRILKKYSEKAKEEKIKIVSDKLGNSVNQLNSILNGFLYLSRAEGMVDTQFSLIHPDDIRSAIDIEIEYLIAGKEVNINYEFQLIDLFYSLHIVRIILVNLISNAIKFSKPGVPGTINVLVRNTEDQLELQVEDQGVGVDLKNPNTKIFQLFNRSIASSDISGHGIGLYMVKKVIERNRGEITFKSELGIGTKIHIQLPLI